MTINTPLLSLVADYIDNETIKFDLDDFAARVTETGERVPRFSYPRSEPAELCNSKFCIAGAAVWLALGAQPYSFPYELKGAQLLGLDTFQAKRLFFAGPGSVWSDVADEYGWAKSSSGEVSDWSQITHHEAAQVLRRIVAGEIVL